MLYPTPDPDTFRAVIAFTEEPLKRVEIELLVRSAETGFHLRYVEHRVSSRPYPEAAWANEHTFSANITPGGPLAAMLEAQVVAEVYNHARCFWEGVG